MRSARRDWVPRCVRIMMINAGTPRSDQCYVFVCTKVFFYITICIRMYHKEREELGDGGPKFNSAPSSLIYASAPQNFPACLPTVRIRLDHFAYQYPVLYTGSLEVCFFHHISLSSCINFWRGSGNVEIFRNRGFSSHSSNCSL